MMTGDELALRSDPTGLQRAAIAAAENVRDARTALRMIREALEAKAPVPRPDASTSIGRGPGKGRFA